MFYECGLINNIRIVRRHSAILPNSIECGNDRSDCQNDLKLWFPRIFFEDFNQKIFNLFLLLAVSGLFPCTYY